MLKFVQKCGKICLDMIKKHPVNKVKTIDNWLCVKVESIKHVLKGGKVQYKI